MQHHLTHTLRRPFAVAGLLFVLASAALADDPTITSISNRTINEDSDTGNITFTVDDAETAAGSLVVTASSNNTTVIPNSGITYPGTTGAVRSILVTPAANRNTNTAGGGDSPVTITVTVRDGDNDTDTETFTVRVNAVNDRPTITPGGPTAVSDNAASPIAILASPFAVNDIDQGRPDDEVLTVSITIDQDDVGLGQFTEIPLGGSNPIVNASNASLLTLTGKPADITTFVRANLKYTPSPNSVPVTQTPTLNLLLSVSDGSLTANANTNRQIAYTSFNDPPTGSVSTTAVNAFESAPVAPFGNFTAADVDLDDMITVSITNTGGGTFGPGLPFTGTPEAVVDFMHALEFTPGTADVTFTVTLGDTGGASVPLPATSMTVQEVNRDPQIAGITTALIRTDEEVATSLFSTVSVVDPDGDPSLTATITFPRAKGELSAGTRPAASDVYTLTAGTGAAITTALRALQFTPANGAGGSVVNFTLTVTDAGALSASDSRTRVEIIAVNGAPSIVGVPTVLPDPISPTQPKPFSTIEILDSDVADPLTVTVSLDNPAKGGFDSATLGGFTDLGGGTYAFDGTPSVATTALKGLLFVPHPDFNFPAGAPGATTFTITVDDGVNPTATEVFDIILESRRRTILVTNPDDTLDPGTLRTALAAAKPDDTITFALPGYPATIRVGSVLALDNNLNFRGPGADKLTLSGDADGNGTADNGLFTVRASVTMEGLTLAKGLADNGGAISVTETGNLTMRACAIIDSTASAWGGAIDVDRGKLALESCLLRGNSTGSGFGLGGGAVSLYTTQACSFVNCTFAENAQSASSGFGGGAIYAENSAPADGLVVTISHCTFASNTDAVSAGTSVQANVFGTAVTMQNCIVADGLGGNLKVAGSASIDSLGGNISDDQTRSNFTQGGVPQFVILFDQASDQTLIDPQLDPLAMTVGPLPSYAISPFSPAIGAAEPVAAPVDSRGVLRSDGDPDSGAHEAGDPLRLVLNEIAFSGTGAPFLEFYNPRDSMPLDLTDSVLEIDGVPVHTFTAAELSPIQPGRGVILAKTDFMAGNTPVVDEAALVLKRRGLIELVSDSGGVLISVEYTGVVADLADPALDYTPEAASITLAAQFGGAAYVPHEMALDPNAAPMNGVDPTGPGDPSSPGKDSGGTEFGASNAKPNALADSFLFGEDQDRVLDVLANDIDSDGGDVLVIVDVTGSDASGANDKTATSTLGATVDIRPADNGTTATPHRGLEIAYNPREATAIQSIPEGGEMVDTFTYSIVDITTGHATSFVEDAGDSTVTIVNSAAHRLLAGAKIVVAEGPYAGSHPVSLIAVGPDDTEPDRFTIPVAYSVDGGASAWEATESRPLGPGLDDTTRDTTTVSVTLLGANDPPTPVMDTVTTPEDQVLRIMADSALAGTNTVFDTDPLYPLPRAISNMSLLLDDTDPDSDDDGESLRVVAVLSSINPVGGYVQSPGAVGVTVSAAGHGLSDDDTILIAGYRGHPSYNAVHTVTVLDPDRFTIPIAFVDDNPTRGSWAPYVPGAQLAATSLHGAPVTLEARADPDETNIVYNPRPSPFLDGIGFGDTEPDTFFYVVSDRHGGLGLAEIRVNVTGVNDDPVPTVDPGTLAGLGLPTDDLSALGDALGDLGTAYLLPSSDASPDRVLVGLFDPADPEAGTTVVDQLWVTDEATPLAINVHQATSGPLDPLANDTDVDRGDVLTINTPDAVLTSREGARVTVSADGRTLTYDPSVSDDLDGLSRDERLIDTVIVRVNDSVGPGVESLIAVMVIGLNDTPEPDTLATTLTFTTPEDQLYTIGEPGVLHDDKEPDQNGTAPDDRKILVPSTGQTSTVPDVIYSTVAELIDGSLASSVIYDPRGSLFDHGNPTQFALDGLAVDQSYIDTITYETWDGSYVFAMDDMFKVTADSPSAELDVLANDSNLTGITTMVSLVSTSPTSAGGTATVVDGKLSYTPAVGFVGDELFTYTAEDELGNSDSGQVLVRVTVEPLNGNLQAKDDAFTVALGQMPVLDVLANDDVMPDGVGVLSIESVSAAPTKGTAEVVPGGIRYTPAPAASGMDSFEYELSGGGTARATATVAIEIVDREDALFTRADLFSVLVASEDNPLDVLANDNILPGNGLVLTVAPDPSDLPDHGTLEVNAASDGFTYSPDAGFTGVDEFKYLADDGYGGTGSATVKVTVGSLVTNNDFFVVADDSAALGLDVLANDMVLDSPDGAVSITGFAATSGGTPDTTLMLGAMGALGDIDLVGGEIQFTASGTAGEATFYYTIADPTGRTAVGMAALAVVDDAVSANADFYSVLLDSAATDLNVLANDSAVPARPLAIVSIGTGLDAPDQGGSAQVVDTPEGQRIRYQPASGFIGQETFTYTITDANRQDAATVVVRVGRGDLYANGDVYTVFYELDGTTPTAFTLPVLSNDLVLPDNGEALTITGVGIDDSNQDNAPSEDGSVVVGAGATDLVYTPALGATPPGNATFFTERFTYIISDGTERRSEAGVTIEVHFRDDARDMDTNDDTFTVATDSLGNSLDVLANDGVKPAPILGWTINEPTVPVLHPSGTGNGGTASVSGGSILYTPPAGFVGFARFDYSVSDGLGGTGDATVIVKVGDVRVCGDRYAVLSDSTGNSFDVLANDGVLPDMPEGTPNAGFVLDTTAIATSNGGTASVIGGTILYAPAAGYVGVESFNYWVLDDSGNRYPGEVVVSVEQAGADRAPGSAEIIVTGVNDLPVITGTANFTITDKETITPFEGVSVTDVDDQGEEPISLSVSVGDPARGLFYHPGGLFVRNGNVWISAPMTPAAATAALADLIFQPTTAGRVDAGNSELATLSITADDGRGTTTDASTEITTEHPTRSQVLPLNLAGDESSQTEAFFGNDVAISGDLMAVGSRLRNTPATDAGRVYVYQRTTDAGVDSWQQIAMIEAADGTSPDNFGTSVSISGNTLVVGSPNDRVGGLNGAGSAYVFERDAGGPNNWGQVKKLIIVAGDRAEGDRFGDDVAISGNTIIVGAPFAARDASLSGTALIFERDEGGDDNWGVVQEIGTGYAEFADWFGTSVAIDGNNLIVGAHGSNVTNDEAGFDIGAAHVYSRANATSPWAHVKKLSRFSDPRSRPFDYFGFSVAIDGDTVMVGSPQFNPIGGAGDAGAVYMFAEDIGGTDNWGLLFEYIDPDPRTDQRLGFAVALRDGIALAGADSQHPNTDAGYVLCFVRDLGSDNWQFTDTLLPPDPTVDPNFGAAVAVNGSTVVVGAQRDSDNPNNRLAAGAVYTYQLRLLQGSEAEFGLTGISSGPGNATMLEMLLPLGARCFVEWSDDLVVWHPDPQVLIGESIPISWTDPVPRTANSRRFYRVIEE